MLNIILQPLPLCFTVPLIWHRRPFSSPKLVGGEEEMGLVDYNMLTGGVIHKAGTYTELSLVFSQELAKN